MARSSPTASAWRPRRSGRRRRPRRPSSCMHEGLGCVALWRDFPQKLAHATGFGVFVYSRAGYGRSDPGRPAAPARLHDPRGPLFPAGGPRRDRVPPRRPRRPQRRRLDRRDLSPASATTPGSRASCLIAPHLFTEPAGLAAIAEAKRAYETGDLKVRLARHHAHVDAAFLGWNGAWLDPGFKAWTIESFVERWRDARPRHPGDGRSVRHARPGSRDRKALARAGRDARPRQLPPCAAIRTAGRNS